MSAATRERASWREVLMPERVAALPRSAGGLPVPYVATWEGEDEMVIRPCPNANGQRAVYPAHGSQVGKTAPVFGVMEPSRQREVVMQVRCQVCRLQLPPIEPVRVGEVHWLVDLLHEPKTMRGHLLALEPWVCDDCLVYALQVCPGLLAKRGRVRRVLAVVTANCVAAITKPHGNLEGREPCVGYLKIEPLRYVRIASAHVLEYGPTTIREMLAEDGCP